MNADEILFMNNALCLFQLTPVNFVFLQGIDTLHSFGLKGVGHLVQSSDFLHDQSRPWMLY